MSYFAVARILDGHNQLVGFKIANYLYSNYSLAEIKAYSLRGLVDFVNNGEYITNLFISDEIDGIEVTGVDGDISRYSAFNTLGELVTEEVWVLVNKNTESGYYDLLNPFGVPRRVYTHELNAFQSKSGIYANTGWLSERDYKRYVAAVHRDDINNLHIANAIVCDSETGKDIRYINNMNYAYKYNSGFVPDDYFRPELFSRKKPSIFKLPDISKLEVSDEHTDNLNNIFSNNYEYSDESTCSFIRLIHYDDFIYREKRLRLALERKKKSKSSEDLEYNGFYSEYQSSSIFKQKIMLRTDSNVPMDSNGHINTNGSKFGMYHEILVFGAFNVLNNGLNPIDKNYWSNVYLGILQLDGKHGKDFIIDLGHENYLRVRDIVYIGKAYISLLKAYCEANMLATKTMALFRRVYNPQDNVIIALGKIGLVFIRVSIRDRESTDVMYDYYGDCKVCEQKIKTVLYTKIMTYSGLEREINLLISSGFLPKNFSLDSAIMTRILHMANRATYKVYEDPISTIKIINVYDDIIPKKINNLLGHDGVANINKKWYRDALTTTNEYAKDLFIALNKSNAFRNSLDIEFSNCIRAGAMYRCNFFASPICVAVIFNKSDANLAAHGSYGYIESRIAGDSRLKLLDLAQSALIKCGLLDASYKDLIGTYNYELALRAIFNADISIEDDELTIYSIYGIKFKLSEVINLANQRMQSLSDIKDSLGITRAKLDLLNFDVKINNAGYIIDFSGSPKVYQSQGIRGIIFKNFMLDNLGQLTILMQGKFDIFLGDKLRSYYYYPNKAGVVCLLYRSNQLDLMHEMLSNPIPAGINVTLKYNDGDMDFDTFYREFSILFLSRIVEDIKHITMDLVNYMHSIYSSTYIDRTLNLVRTVFYDVNAVPKEYKERILRLLLSEFNIYIKQYNKTGNLQQLDSKKCMIKLVMASLYSEKEYKKLNETFDKKVPI